MRARRQQQQEHYWLYQPVNQCPTLACPCCRDGCTKRGRTFARRSIYSARAGAAPSGWQTLVGSTVFGLMTKIGALSLHATRGCLQRTTATQHLFSVLMSRAT